MPRLAGLRQSIIHNDANDLNVVVGGGQSDPFTKNQRVLGLIDFGDAVYSYTVAGLAIALAYAVLDKSDPLATMCQLVRGYHAELPLTETELTVVYPLALLRLCVSASVAGYQMQQRPDDPYLAISQEPIRRTLPKLMALHPRFVEVALRQACGLVGSISAEKIRNYLATTPAENVLQGGVSAENSLTVDWSVGSPLLEGVPWETDAERMSQVVFEQMEMAGKGVGIGRYDEARLIYNAPAFATGPDPLDERRTIHFGVDLCAPTGTAVCTPFNGTLRAAVTCPAHLDYGHAIVLEHATDDGTPFFSLYGHLSAKSIQQGWVIGDPFKAGEVIGWLGDVSENGGWPPHLHFQLMTDMLDYRYDFPAIAPASQRDVWKEFLPNPNLILHLPDAMATAQPPSKAQTLQHRLQITGGNLSVGYRDHVKVERGWMQYLYDETGRKYLDAYNNVPHVGHCHPHVVEAAWRQYGVLNTNTRYLQDSFNYYAERLAATFPDPLNVVYLVNSGSEANELALRLARTVTGRRDLIVNEGAYHGHTTSLIDISPYKHDGPGGVGAPDWVHTLAVADVYRGKFKADNLQAAQLFADELLPIIRRIEQFGRGLCGFMHETCPSVGGQIIFPAGYLAAAYQHVRDAGGVCIADEVQTGFGRIGTHFYAFQQQNVIPDIVVLGKPIGNGHPLAAVVTTHEIADAFDNGMEFFSTFGGSSVSCSVGAAVLDVLEREPLQANAHRVGLQMLDGFWQLQERFEIIGDVRGSGLFLGIELVRDRVTLEPAAAEASFVANEMRQHGILLGTDGPLHNVIKIRPPMPFDAGNADLLLSHFEQILTESFGS